MDRHVGHTVFKFVLLQANIQSSKEEQKDSHDMHQNRKLGDADAALFHGFFHQLGSGRVGVGSILRPLFFLLRLTLFIHLTTHLCHTHVLLFGGSVRYRLFSWFFRGFFIDNRSWLHGSRFRSGFLLFDWFAFLCRRRFHWHWGSLCDGGRLFFGNSSGNRSFSLFFLGRCCTTFLEATASHGRKLG